MNPVTKALGALIAINMQAALMIMLGFWGKDYLDERVPLAFSWVYIMVPVVLIAVVHSYYVMIRYLMRVDRQMRGDKGGSGRGAPH